jgi:hypothetical protein
MDFSGRSFGDNAMLVPEFMTLEDAEDWIERNFMDPNAAHAVKRKIAEVKLSWQVKLHAFADSEYDDQDALIESKILAEQLWVYIEIWRQVQGLPAQDNSMLGIKDFKTEAEARKFGEQNKYDPKVRTSIRGWRFFQSILLDDLKRQYGDTQGGREIIDMVATRIHLLDVCIEAMGDYAMISGEKEILIKSLLADNVGSVMKAHVIPLKRRKATPEEIEKFTSMEQYPTTGYKSGME